ncbi:MAG: hypothetical protein VKL59_12370 [Nostocaceae cyanobacterium]|nr:hypothetical protein [Nostocaceae cyanobacterium]
MGGASILGFRGVYLFIWQERNKHYLFAMLAVDAKAKIYQDKIYPTVGGYGQ